MILYTYIYDSIYLKGDTQQGCFAKWYQMLFQNSSHLANAREILYKRCLPKGLPSRNLRSRLGLIFSLPY